MSEDPENTLVLETTRGEVAIAMRPDLAPRHVARIKELVRDGLYNGTVFHRVIEGFMAQTGDPTGPGSGRENTHAHRAVRLRSAPRSDRVAAERSARRRAPHGDPARAAVRGSPGTRAAESVAARRPARAQRHQGHSRAAPRPAA